MLRRGHEGELVGRSACEPDEERLVDSFADEVEGHEVDGSNRRLLAHDPPP
jgi:hypothetical protein